MNRSLVPIGGLVTVLIIGVVLILVVTIRPWGGADGGWDTHLNFRDDVPSDYSRTTVTFVDTQPGEPEGWEVADKVDDEPVGYPIYVARGCASCHGLQGEGGAVGPPIAGAFPQVVRVIVRLGPEGMPAYSEGALSERELEAIIEYLRSLAQSTAE